MKDHFSRLRSMVQMATSLVFDDDGNATCLGADEDDELNPTVGYHFGFYSRPNDGTRGLVLKADGEGNTSFLIAFRDKQYEMTLSKGEVGIKNAFNATLLLDKDGQIILNGGTKKVARVDDTVNAGWLVFTPNVPPAGAASLIYLPPETLPVPNNILYPPPMVLLHLTGKIDSGADKVKA